jgi:hypothetical protein
VQIADALTTRRPGEQQALARAKQFAESLLHAPLEAIAQSSGMRVMRNIYDPETDSSRDVVIRSINQLFWDSCLNFVDTPHHRVRVCAAGTPGTGKSSSIPFLIRVLLQRSSDCTVVYRLRKMGNAGWYYELRRHDDVVHVAVYAEKTELVEIRSLSSCDTYYIVDPGKTKKDSCEPEDDFKPKTIIVASPDEMHWGGSEFHKRRRSVRGRLRYYPIWTLEELLGARSILGSILSQSDVEDRYRSLGGVPGSVFDEIEVENAELRQSEAINSLTPEQATKIAFGDLPGVGTLDSSQPKSAVVGLTSDGRNGFKTYDSEVLSPLVAEKIYSKFMDELWNAMLSNNRSVSWKIFEAYTRHLLASERISEFDSRFCVGMTTMEVFGNTFRILLGGCERIQLSSDLASAALSTPNVVHHSVSGQHPLIDFIYQGKDGVIHAFQAAMGERRNAGKEEIDKLHQAVGEHRSLRLYYLVPAERFHNFVTDPVMPVPYPEMAAATSLLRLYHVMVPNPRTQQSTREL